MECTYTCVPYAHTKAAQRYCFFLRYERFYTKKMRKFYIFAMQRWQNGILMVSMYNKNKENTAAKVLHLAMFSAAPTTTTFTNIFDGIHCGHTVHPKDVYSLAAEKTLKIYLLFAHQYCPDKIRELLAWFWVGKLGSPAVV